MEIKKQEIEKLINMIPGDTALYQVSPQGLNTLYYSPDIPGLSGMTREQYDAAIKEDALAIVLPEDRGIVHEKLTQSLSAGGDADVTYRIFHRTQGFIWIHAKARVLGTLEGCPLLITIYLNTSNETEIFSDLLDNTNNIVFVSDLDHHKLLYANRAARNYAGAPQNQFSTLNCYQYILGRSDPCPWCKGFESKPGVIDEFDHYDESHDTYQHITTKYIDWCGHPARAHFINDITEIKRLSRHLEAEKNSLADIITNIPAGIAVFRIDPGGFHYITANPLLFKTLDISPDDLDDPAQAAIADKLHPDDLAPAFAMLKQLTQGPCSGVRADFRLKDPSGDGYRWMHMEGHSVRQSAQSLMTFSALSDITVQKAAETALMESQRRYETAIQSAHLMVWELDLKTNIAITAKGGFSEHGLPDRMENATARFADLIEPGDRSRFFAMHERMAEGAPVASCEVWVRMPNSRLARCARITYATIVENGLPVRAYGVAQDISQQKLDEEKYKGLIHDMLKATPQSVASLRLNLTQNRIEDFSCVDPDIQQAVTGSDVDDLLAYTLDTFIDAERLKALSRERFSRSDLLERFRSGQSQVSADLPAILPHTGARIWITLTLSIAANPQTEDTEAFAAVLDCTEAKTEELIVSRITETEYDYIALIDPAADTLTYRQVNTATLHHAAMETTSYSGDYLNPANWSLLPENAAAFLADMVLQRVIDQLGVQEHYEVSATQHDAQGRTRRKQFQFTYLDASHQALLLIKSDITTLYLQEQRQLAQLQEALDAAKKANDMKSRFLSNVSHDMRTPLNGIIGYTDLARESDDPQVLQDYLAKIKASSQVLHQLINDTLDLNKIETGQIILKEDRVDLDALINRVVTVIRPTLADKQIRFHLDISRSASPQVQADSMRLQEILLNLLNNAVKFTPYCGTIALTVVGSRRSKTSLTECITVKDNGVGISPEFLPQIFEPFSQERTAQTALIGGSGLGLAIVKELVDRMGGSIDVHSTPGQGTVFVVRLDFDLAGPAASEAKAVPDPSAILKGKHILLVEDNPLNSEIARALLLKAGMSVDTAVNGQEGVARFEESAAGTFNAILMDIRMPVLNGYDATRRIRALPRPDARLIPIIAMTADAYAQDVQRCLDAGMNDHVAKPVNPRLLYEALARHFI